MSVPDDCPVHDMDPTATVWIDVGGVVLPYSVEQACGMHHAGAAIQPLVDSALAAIDRDIAAHTDLPECYRRVIE